MRIVARSLWWAITSGSIAALFLAPVPAGHAGADGAGPGLRWHVPLVRPLLVGPAQRRITLGDAREPPIPIPKAGARLHLLVEGDGLSASAIRPALEAHFADATAAELRERAKAAPYPVRIIGIGRAAAQATRAERQQAGALDAELSALRQAAAAEAEARAREGQGAEERAARDEAATARSRAQILREADAAIERIQAQVERQAQRRLAAADVQLAGRLADAELTVARAEAGRDRLMAAALAADGGRWHTAIEAARRFQIGDLHLDSSDPLFFQKFGSVSAWRAFFLAQ